MKSWLIKARVLDKYKVCQLHLSLIVHVAPLKGAGTAVQLILFNFANYSPSISMELKVSKEITCVNDKIRDPLQTNMSPQHYFLSCKQQGSTMKNC